MMCSFKVLLFYLVWREVRIGSGKKRISFCELATAKAPRRKEAKKLHSFESALAASLVPGAGGFYGFTGLQPPIRLVGEAIKPIVAKIDPAAKAPTQWTKVFCFLF